MTNIKNIVKNNTAIFEYAIAGVLYYKIETEEYKYLFSIDMNDTADVGSATFNATEKAITLMRWIRKCIKNDTFVEIKIK